MRTSSTTWIVCFLAFLLAPIGSATAQSRNLEIYWVDTEGGGATLLVSPSGESLLVDAGWEVNDRDAKRIHAAAQDVGLKTMKIDVDSEQGVVTLKGNVDSEDTRRRAEATARKVSGVTQVRNQLHAKN